MTDSATTTTSRSRDSRRARARAPAAKYPYIVRHLAPVELLSTEAVEIIEANAEMILEDIGIEFRRDPESLRLWREAGADVQGERVHIPRGMAR
ncbi:MAG: trimethylamine methyltransferase family protein, partial [Gammaproteobacteria bacterium]|nr:trimethylamine methyltransferase family protein [Gammaproteobacteria bacterium]